MLFVITVIMLVVTLWHCLNIELKVDTMVDEKYIEILKPMLSVGDIVALNVYIENDGYKVGIVTSIFGDKINYISEDGRKDWIYIKQISKIYCNDEMAKKVKAKAVKNFEETLENAIINSK